MKLSVEIDMDNDAFGTTPKTRQAELSKIMHEQVLRHNNLRKSSDEVRLRDTNGNTCGWAKVTP